MARLAPLIIFPFLSLSLGAKKGCRQKMNSGGDVGVVLSALPHTYTNEKELPAFFDWRSVEGVNFVSKDLNQHIPHYCGSCWLHSGIGQLNDRLKIARKGQWPEVNLARQVVLNCGKDIAGSCGGGEAFGVFKFAHLYGLPDDSCQLYSAQEYECSPFRNCMNCDPQEGSQGDCYAVQSYGRYFVTEYAHMPPFPELTPFMMKAEIFKRGPISCGVDSSVVEKGRYLPGMIVRTVKQNSTELWSLDHDIVVVGWGIDPSSRTEYWIVRNSWGTFWGDHGWFKVEMGVNAMGIEQDCAWAVVQAEPRIADYGPSDKSQDFPSTEWSAYLDAKRKNSGVLRDYWAEEL